LQISTHYCFTSASLFEQGNAEVSPLPKYFRLLWRFQHALLLKTINDNHEVRRMAIAILHYLRDHPSAQDSASGIAKWWVSEKREVVEKALALLVKEGVMEKRRQLYRLAQDEAAPADRTGVERTLRRLQRRKT
jgi:hypothetical protein